MNDLISRQAVLMSLADYQLQESPNWGANGMGNTDAYEAITECIRVIEQAPTIDPVKHGKWIECESSEHWKCSACGCRASFWFDEENSSSYELDLSEWLSGYCQNCGARMDGE